MSKTKVLLTTLCLAAGVAAVAGAVTVETIPVVAMPGPAAARPALPPAPVGNAPALTAALVKLPAPAAAAEPAGEARPSLTVPDFKGKRLSVARREGRKLGLVISARDDYGQRVAADVAPYYRVRRQLTEAGALVDPGAAVEVRVRELESPSGY